MAFDKREGSVKGKNYPVPCRSTACFAREVEDQRSGNLTRNHLAVEDRRHHPLPDRAHHHTPKTAASGLALVFCDCRSALGILQALAEDAGVDFVNRDFEGTDVIAGCIVDADAEEETAFNGHSALLAHGQAAGQQLAVVRVADVEDDRGNEGVDVVAGLVVDHRGKFHRAMMHAVGRAREAELAGVGVDQEGEGAEGLALEVGAEVVVRRRGARSCRASAPRRRWPGWR